MYICGYKDFYIGNIYIYIYIWGVVVCLAVGNLYQYRYVKAMGPWAPICPMGPWRLCNAVGGREQTRNGHIYIYIYMNVFFLIRNIYIYIYVYIYAPKRVAKSCVAGCTEYQPDMLSYWALSTPHDFLWPTTCMALTNRHPHITVTRCIAHRIICCNLYIIVTALVAQ